MMQDGKALQAGTSHDLGQNFGKAFNVTFQSTSGEREHVWQTSWGVSTRLIGAVIMTHSDDEGLVLPPKLAPIHVVIVPIYRKDDEKTKVMDAAEKIAKTLRDDGLTVELDAREGLKPGAKYYEWERKGVPMRLELGPRDREARAVMCKMRIAPVDANGKAVKETLSWDDLGVQVGQRLDAFQKMLFERALAYREARTKSVDTWAEFVAAFNDSESSFVYAHWDGTTATELAIKEETKATIRCLPLDGQGPAPSAGKCIKTGNPSARRVLFAKNY
jgi:prolyl-tRNA synthetase